MGSTTSAAGRLVIAVLTYRRLEDIVELVPLLVQHTRACVASGAVGEASVLVVDNDPEGGARASVEALGLPDVRYVHEVAPGIAHARNRALEEATDADLLVFVDDDERPEPGWLAALVSLQQQTGAAAVAGAVAPVEGLVTDPWIVEGGFFVRRRHRTGEVLDAASTANLLLDLRQTRALGDPCFDVRFGSTGGSDTLYTRTLVSRGGRIVWCDEAVVRDFVRSARMTRRWVLQRAYRSGNSWGRCEVELATGMSRPLTRLRLVAAGSARVAGGLVKMLLGLASRSPGGRARGARTVARGAGMVAGASGAVYEEYRRPVAAGGATHDGS